MVREAFCELTAKTPGSSTPGFLADEDRNKAIAEVSSDRAQAGLVLLELVAFRPYFPFSREQASEVKGLSVDWERRWRFLEQRSKELGFLPQRASELDLTMRRTEDSMTGKWLKIAVATSGGVALGALTFGIAAPFIGALYCATVLGLHGAAALTAGLAAIGGGAVAAGGLGIAGGTSVLVGGGALLGFGAGVATGFASTLTKGGALLQAIKLEVALKEFVLQGQYDNAKAQEILFQHRSAIEKLEREIDDLRTKREADELRLKDLEGAVEVLRKALKRNQALVKAAE